MRLGSTDGVCYLSCPVESRTGTLVTVRSRWSVNWKGLRAAVEGLWVDYFEVEFEDIERDTWVWGRELRQDSVGKSCLSGGAALKGWWTGC